MTVTLRCVVNTLRDLAGGRADPVGGTAGRPRAGLSYVDSHKERRVATEGSGPGDAYAVRREDGVIVCSCGDRLADHIRGDTVVIDGMEFQFRRRNDHMICRRCGVSHPMRGFRESGSAPGDTGDRRRSSDL